MTTVTVDGVPYAPVSETGPRIGVGITTRNRPEQLAKTIEEIVRLTPGAKIVVVDDASQPEPQFNPDGTGYYHFAENVGIAAAKNKCLELLEDCEHIFLFDDDAYPLVEGWWKPYVESPEPHLMYIFEDLVKSKLRDIKRIYADIAHVAYTWPRGVMLYVERRVLDVVGGMDIGYGKWGYEHGDWSGRIHNAGLTTWRFGDVTNSGSLIYSLDENEEIDRGVKSVERRKLAAENVVRYREKWDSTEYHEFRQPQDIVLSCLFSTVPDPQRPHAKPLTAAATEALGRSLGHRDLLLFTDAEVGAYLDNTYPVLVDISVDNLYIQRWISYWHHLRDNPGIRNVWCVDGTDVEMLRDPFDLDPTKLYLGSEPTTVGSGWLGKNSSTSVNRLVTSRSFLLMYNAGLVGGSRKVVMDFIHDMLKAYFDNQTQVFLNKDSDITHVVNDMGILNVVAHGEKWEGRIVTGPEVHTVFKRDERNAWSRWKHK